MVGISDLCGLQNAVTKIDRLRHAGAFSQETSDDLVRVMDRALAELEIQVEA